MKELSHLKCSNGHCQIAEDIFNHRLKREDVWEYEGVDDGVFCWLNLAPYSPDTGKQSGPSRPFFKLESFK